MDKSSRISFGILKALPLLVLPALVFALGYHWPGWIFMWVFAGSIFLGCKCLVLMDAARDRMKISMGRALAFLFLWPGMDADFLSTSQSPKKISLKTWGGAVFKTLLGVALFWVLPRFLPNADPLLVGWSGMLGLIFLFHFGGFELIALCWQSLGIPADPLMRSPVFAQSLSEFWGERWNRAFRKLGHRYIFAPLRSRIGTAAAGFSVFLASGFVHDLVISVPARGGYGLPTAYFVFQGAGVALERSAWGKRMGIDHGARGWLMMALWTAGPAYFLFHPPFVKNVILPMMQAMKAY